MAERRMFTKKITDGDAFTALPPTTQALYFHLCMGADDDGFNNKIRQSMFNAHADQKDYNLLVQQRFIIPFDAKGVIAIKHWKMHNIIRADRYHKTEYVEERAALILKENGVYTENDNQVTTTCQPSDNQMETEVRLGKDSIGKDSIGKSKAFTPPTLDEVRSYCKERHNGVDAQRFIDFYESKGWMIGKNRMKDWKACVRTWEKSNKKDSGINERNNSSKLQELEERFLKE